MLNRRTFIQAAALALPLASCGSREEAPAESGASSGATIGNLTGEQMDIARRDAAQFERVLEVVRKGEVPYGVEPRFFPSV
jgi:hypothetical protein